MQKRTKYTLSSEDMKEAISQWLKAKNITEWQFVEQKEGFFPQRDYEIEIIEDL